LRFGWFFQRAETKDTRGDIPPVTASISASEVAKLSLGESQRGQSVIKSHMGGRSVELCLADYAISKAVSEFLPLYPGPYRWDHERRSIMRCELDAAFFHLYLGTPKE
jgi:hypothetical protein